MLYPFFRLELGKRQEITHQNAEEEVGWHGKHGSYKAGCHPVDYHIHDVLHAGKAETDETGVDNAVEILVEVLVAPDENHENREFT